MPTATVYNWIYRGWITARHAPGSKYWIITADARGNAAAPRAQSTARQASTPAPAGHQPANRGQGTQQ